jgi:predicted rRNA methylase YqxC with S4 and FtsJ domains
LLIHPDDRPHAHRSSARRAGLFESRAKAQAAIEASLVVADDMPVGKASEAISRDAVLSASRRIPSFRVAA